MGDNTALHHHIEESSQVAAISPWMVNHPLPQLRNISTPLQWIYCMITYIAVCCPDEATRECLAYARLITKESMALMEEVAKESTALDQEDKVGITNFT